VTLAVDAGNHHEILGENAVVQAVGELRQENAPRRSVHNCERLGSMLNGCHRKINGTTERGAQPRTLRLVPLEGLLNVSLSGRREEERLH
jgi:hypothetical protein